MDFSAAALRLAALRTLCTLTDGHLQSAHFWRCLIRSAESLHCGVFGTANAKHLLRSQELAREVDACSDQRVPLPARRQSCRCLGSFNHVRYFTRRLQQSLAQVVGRSSSGVKLAQVVLLVHLLTTCPKSLSQCRLTAFPYCICPAPFQRITLMLS